MTLPTTKPNVAEILKTLSERFTVCYGSRLVNLILYGSHARGDATEESDIDALVVLDSPVNEGEEISRTGDILEGLCLEHGVLVSCVYVSEERLNTERSPLLLNVRREGIGILREFIPHPFVAGFPADLTHMAQEFDTMMPEQLTLLQMAQESLRVARFCEDTRSYDIAASRAYYTMFYVAQAFLLGKGLSFSKHTGVIDGFGQHFTRTGLVPAEFHRYLKQGQEKRLTGDYSTVKRLTREEAIEQVAHAEQFLALAERMLGPIPASDAETP